MWEYQIFSQSSSCIPLNHQGKAYAYQRQTIGSSVGGTCWIYTRDVDKVDGRDATILNDIACPKRDCQIRTILPNLMRIKYENYQL